LGTSGLEGDRGVGVGWPLQVWKHLIYAELSAPSHMLAAAAAVAVHGDVASTAP